MFVLVLVLGFSSLSVAVDPSWKFLTRYPKHVVATQLAAGQHIQIDGKLDETPWSNVKAEAGFGDIKQWLSAQYLNRNSIPSQCETSVKVVIFDIPCWLNW
jgi:hypothetical protein